MLSLNISIFENFAIGFAFNISSSIYYFFVIVDNPGSYLYANIGLLNVFFGPTDLVGFIVEFFSLSSYSLDLGRYSLISPIYLAFLSLIF